MDEKTSKVYIRRDMIFNEHDFGHNSEEVTHRDLPDTIEVESTPEVETEPHVGFGACSRRG